MRFLIGAVLGKGRSKQGRPSQHRVRISEEMTFPSPWKGPRCAGLYLHILRGEPP